MNCKKPAGVGQRNDAPAPPVEIMYFLPALTHAGTFAATNGADGMPEKFSLPHVPSAKAQVIAV
jgi:hypothetical protein